MRLIIALVLLIAQICFAAVRMDSYIDDNMVIQRDLPFCLRGETSQGKPGLTAVISLGGIVSSGVTNSTGSFQVCFGARPLNNTPSVMMVVVQGEQAITFNNILFGDVHVCSGQSNMVNQRFLIFFSNFQ